MAIFQPSQITPSVLSGIGNGTVDISNNNINVSWHINGQSGMVGYALEVYDTSAFAYLAKFPSLYNADNPTSVYETLLSPAYGYASDGSPLVFSTGDIVLSQVPQAAALENGKAYQLKIVQFWQDAQGQIQYIKQNSNSVFYTRSAPTVSIDTIGTGGVLASRSNKFTGDYSQDEGDALNWFEWTIALQDDPDNPFFDSGKITGAGEISCTYDGFFTGESYVITLTVQTQNGVTATAEESFDVSYSTPSTTVWAGASCVQGTDAVLVQWNTPNYIEATAVGDYSIDNNKCTLQYGSEIEWPSAGSFEFAKPWSFIYRVSLRGANAWLVYIPYKSGKQFTIRYSKADQRIVFWSSYGGIVGKANNVPDESTLTIQVTPTTYTVAVDGGGTTSGEFPNDFLQGTISSVLLRNDQVCDYLTILEGSSTSGQTKYFNIDFSNGLVATSDVGEGSAPSGFDIYRAASGSTLLTKVATVSSPDSNQLYDYAVASQRGPYVYYIFPFSEGNDYAAFSTNVISPCWWNYTLMECQETNDKKIFTVLRAFRFRNNIETAAVSNNNNPGILQNFTPYPTVQLSPNNYKSSVLTSLIGVVTYDTDDGQPQYLDSIQTRDAIYFLSVTRNPLFLKTRKGDLIRVKISGAISMQTADATVEQMQTMTLPWVEVGSADGVSLYSTTYVGVQEDEGQHTTPGSNVNIEALTLSSNGTYTAPAGTAYTPVYAQIPYYDGSVETV